MTFYNINDLWTTTTCKQRPLFLGLEGGRIVHRFECITLWRNRRLTLSFKNDFLYWISSRGKKMFQMDPNMSLTVNKKICFFCLFEDWYKARWTNWFDRSRRLFSIERTHIKLSEDKTTFTRCQFHQCFTCTIFCTKFWRQKLQSCVLGLKLERSCRKDIKRARKTLMKLTTVSYNFLYWDQRVQYNKTRESVEIYTTTANKLPHQKRG